MDICFGKNFRYVDWALIEINEGEQCDTLFASSQCPVGYHDLIRA